MANYEPVFQALKAIFAPYAADLAATQDTTSAYMLEGAFDPAFKRPMFFGGVRLGRNYVSFSLMAIYACPELLSGISDELRMHMHGKSTFNFVRIEPERFAELAELTRLSYARFRDLGYVLA